MNGALFSNQIYRRYYRNLEPLVKNRKTQAYVMMILSLLTVSFFGVFAVRPTLSTISHLQRQIQDRTKLNERLDQKINALIQAQEAYQAIESDLPLIYTLLPEHPEFPALLKHLELLAISNEATISSVQFEPIVLRGEKVAAELPNEGDPPKARVSSTPLRFTLAVGGNYPELITFLTELTQLQRIVTIHSVRFVGGESGEGPATLNLGIESQAYYLPK